MKTNLHLVIAASLLGATVVTAAPRQNNKHRETKIAWEICQYQVDKYNGEHEVKCVESDICVDFPLVPRLWGIVALVTRKVLRKDVWSDGRLVESKKTKLAVCKKLTYQLPRAGKIVSTPNLDNEEGLTSNNIVEVEGGLLFPLSHNTICNSVNFNQEEYLVRDPIDCRKFYSCQSSINGAYRVAENPKQWVWLAYPMSCPAGTVFDGDRCVAGNACREKSFHKS